MFLSGRYDRLCCCVVAYCEGQDQETFENTGVNYDATVRSLELINEAGI